jgi:hypothetical protein
MILETILKSDTNFRVKEPSGVCFLFCGNSAESLTYTKFYCSNKTKQATFL